MATTDDAVDEMTVGIGKDAESDTTRRRSALAETIARGGVGWVATPPRESSSPEGEGDAPVASAGEESDRVDEPPTIGEPAEDADHEITSGADADAEATSRRQRRRPERKSVARALVALILVGGLLAAGTWGWQQQSGADSATRLNSQREAFLQAGRQAAINLSTIRADSVDADVNRILSTTGDPFRADFAARAESFKSVVKEAKSVSTGQLAGAGVQSFDGSRAVIVVAANVTTSNSGGKDQEPKSWRMKVTVDRVAGKLLATSVEFVS